jgi:hypothetical protein
MVMRNFGSDWLQNIHAGCGRIACLGRRDTSDVVVEERVKESVTMSNRRTVATKGCWKRQTPCELLSELVASRTWKICRLNKEL